MSISSVSTLDPAYRTDSWARFYPLSDPLQHCIRSSNYRSNRLTLPTNRKHSVVVHGSGPQKWGLHYHCGGKGSLCFWRAYYHV